MTAMTTNAATADARKLREIGAMIVTILTAGAFATIAFDLFGKAISPMLGFATLAPVPLANGVINTIFGSGYRPGAEALHIVAGVIAYPAGWVLIAEPLRKKIAPWFPWIASAIIYGIILWVFALYFMAHLVAGNAAFLGWTGITWVALWGHILFAVVAATVAWIRKT